MLFDTLTLMLAQADKPEKIPEPTRTMIIMALLGIALLGMLLVVGILLGGHWVRRIGSHRRRPPVPPDLILKRKPPKEEPRISHRKVDPGDTMGTDDTMVN